MKRFILQFRRTFVAIILALLMLAGMSGSLLGTALAYSSPNGAQDPYADTAGFLYYAGLKINGAVYAVWNDNTFVNEWSVPQYGEGETVTSVTADTNAGSVLESMGFAVADGQVMISPHEVSMPPGVSVYYESYDHAVIVTSAQQQQQQPTVTITANPTFINQGSSTTIIWNSTNATSCTAITGTGFSGSESTSGSSVVFPSFTQTYTITCSNNIGQSSQASVTVTVNQQQQQQISATITANPSFINQGSSATLIWNSSNATSCIAISGSGFSGNEPTAGSQVVTPSTTQTYTINCFNNTGQSVQASTIITVNQQQQQQPTVTITANPTFINQGSSATLIWNTTNATSCTASGGSGFSGSESTSGSAVVSPSGTTTYSITCFNSTGQSATASVTVTVNQQQQQQPIVTISANPTVISQGSSSILTWNAVNATSCTATSGAGFSGGETTSGSQTVYPTFTQTYTLMCFNNSGQTGAASVTITVNQQQQQPTVTITANPTFVNQGSSSTLIWNSTNATYCTASNGWSGNESTSGSMTVTPSVTTTYTLNCFNGTGQSATASVTITVNQQQPTVTGGGVVAQPPVILCNDDNIPEGTEIMGPDGIKVYIVNAYCYKRHIFNPDIFNMYQNLSWNTIVHVNQPVLDSFKTSDLYQVSGTDFIYKVVEYPSGTAVKHLLEMTPDQLGDFGYDWRSIFIINQQEANYYPTGSPIVPTQQ